MQAYVSARQFRDIRGIRLLVLDTLYANFRDALASRYQEFRAVYPRAALSPDSSQFRAFFDTAHHNDREVLAALAEAFEKIENASPDDGALSVFSAQYLPPRNWAIDSADYSFARYEGQTAVYYLTEFVRLPYANVAFPARSVVRWVLVDRQWFLSIGR